MLVIEDQSNGGQRITRKSNKELVSVEHYDSAPCDDQSSMQHGKAIKNQIQTFDNLSDMGDTSSLNTHQLNVEHEKMLVKYEADIRQHISIEQQL